MVAQEEVKPDEEKPEDPKPDEPPPVTTANVGNGPPDGFGLSAGKGGTGGSGSGGGKRGGSKYGWYAAKVQSAIADAVRRHSKLKNASMTATVRITLDSTGRISRATVSGVDDADLAEALKADVLTGLQLSDAPPADMPMPIVMRVSAKKPASMASR